MKAIGTTKITKELTLNNPEGYIKSVHYDWETDDVTIEIIFKEPGSALKNSRSFVVNSGGKALVGEDIKDFISKHPDLKAFDTAESLAWFTKLINYFKK